MKLLLQALAIAAFLYGSVSAKEGKSNDKVIGGKGLTSPEPFMASLRSLSGIHYCGGTLIHPRAVLTAAHCIKDFKPDVDIGRLKRVGADNSGFLSYKTVELIVHELYDPSSYDYDVAVLILDSDCPLAPIPLATSDSCFEGQSSCDVRLLGWGDTSQGGYFARVLQEAHTSSVSRNTCRALLGDSTVTDRMICAGELEDGKIDSCQGDSGGPMIVNKEQVGIVSFGVGCGRAQRPGVYTSVPELRTWIVLRLASSLVKLGQKLG